MKAHNLMEDLNKKLEKESQRLATLGMELENKSSDP
jgi:hypothetical protein